MQLSEAACALWAKKPKTSVCGENLWLPLHWHMSDAAGTAGHLWDQWLPGGTKKEIAAGVLSPARGGENFARQVFIFLAAAHDLGKASPVFQSKESPMTAQLDEILHKNIRDAGFLLKSNREYNKQLYHSLISHLILDHHGFDKSIAVTVGAHHGKPPSLEQLNNILSIYVSDCGFGDEQWEQAQKELLNYALDLAGLKKADAVVINLEKTAQMLLSALVILADWIASDEDKFPLRDIESCQSMKHPPERADIAWEALKLTPYWNVQQDWDDLYKRRFDIFDKVSPRVSPNPLQEKLLDIVKNCLAPGIVVV